MIITTNSPLCSDLLVIPLTDGTLDVSWSLNTDELRNYLIPTIDKIYNLQENINFNIEIDTTDTFDSINLKSYKFSELETVYRGNIVFSAIIDFNKNKFEEINYFIRVKVDDSEVFYSTTQNGYPIQESTSILDKWSDTLSFDTPINYTKDLVDIMYKTVADFNAYNKEAKSANMYYIFQAVADVLNKEYTYVIDEKNKKLINKVKPDFLMESLGILFKFTDINNITMEEYRRVLKNLIAGYQNGGAWNYIRNTLKYLVGYTPELVTFKNFYPWVLRTKELLGVTTTSDDKNNPIQYGLNDPINFSDRNYLNPGSNYYLFTKNSEYTNNNKVMLLSDKDKTFTFTIYSDNFFNRNIDTQKVKNILDLLKAVYTKYSLNLKEQEEFSLNYIFIDDDDNYLLANEDDPLFY